MFTSLAATAATAAAVLPFHGHGFGFPLFFILGPLFWILVVVLIVSLVSRRRRHWARANGFGPWGQGGGWGHGYWAQAQAARSAETTLAERFAQGDIDEKEYRARLEVLRASVPQPPMPPTK